MKFQSTLLTALFVTTLSTGFSQADSSKGELNFNAYIDLYYGYDLNQPYDNERPDFLFNYGKHNQIGINLALANWEYTKGKLTARLGFNFGDFPNRNMAHEQGLLKALYQANVEYQFAKKASFMMGMFGSHLGFESFASFENLFISHSLASEWTPYYQSGARVTFNPNEKWTLSATVANGTQNITKIPGNTTPALGGQVAFSPNKNITINYSNLYVNDYPDSLAQFMFYNNLYATFTLMNKLDLVTGFDYGINNNTVLDTTNNIMVISFLARYRFSEKWSVGFRAEHYDDPGSVYISTATINPFVTQCYTVGLNYSPMDRVKFRIESRNFTAEKPFYRNDQGTNPYATGTVQYINSNSNILFSVQAKF
ncbi:MAG: porin [Flavobacteriales bacterium]|nr:porin [Flavobacteriales bacterium]